MDSRPSMRPSGTLIQFYPLREGSINPENLLHSMVLRIGHRGASGHAPENTLLSLNTAVQLRCDMTEIDVHTCASGDVVVIHDETVERTTNGTGLVSELSLSELKKLDAGNGERIPTLTEVLSMLKDKIVLNIDLKGQNTPKRVHWAVKDSGWSVNDILITSFDWAKLEKYRELDTEARLGPLAHVNIYHAVRFASKINAYCINPLHKPCSRSFVGKAQKKGLQVYPWTVNEVKDIERMKGFGVDGLISDFPDRV